MNSTALSLRFCGRHTLQQLLDHFKVFTASHKEQTFAITLFCPEVTDQAFFFGIIAAVTVGSLMLNNKDSAIFEFCHEVRIEFPVVQLQIEGVIFTAVKVAHPIFNFIHLVNEHGTLFFFAAVFTVETADYVIIVLFEFVRTFVLGIYRIGVAESEAILVFVTIPSVDFSIIKCSSAIDAICGK